MISKHLPADIRLSKHNGTEKMRLGKIVQDLVKHCLNPTINLPTFYSINMSRVPAVGMEHVDISALMQ